MEDLEILTEVAQTLDRLGIPWMLVGSHASSIWGQYRATHDIDIVVAYQERDIPPLVAALAERYYISPEMLQDGLKHRTISNIIHYEYGEKVDFCPLRDTEYDRASLERRVQAEYRGVPVWVATPEDVVLSKLHWAKDSRSEMQHNDVLMILRVRENLDLKYLRLWAQRLGVSEDLETLLQEAQEV